MAAVLLSNILPTNLHDSTHEIFIPFNELQRKDFDYKTFHIFGCSGQGINNVKNKTKNKLDAKTLDCIYLATDFNRGSYDIL